MTKRAWIRLVVIATIPTTLPLTLAASAQTGVRTDLASEKSLSRSAASMPSTAAVDWRNTTYTMDCAGIAPHPFTVALHDGKGQAPRQPGGAYNRYDIAVEAIANGDLTGDTKPETAVLLYCSPQPSNFYVEEVQAFTNGAQQVGHLPPVAPLPTGSPLHPLFDPGQFSIRNNELLTGVRFYAATDGHAGGPSIHRTLTWRWNGKQFVRASS